MQEVLKVCETVTHRVESVLGPSRLRPWPSVPRGAPPARRESWFAFGGPRSINLLRLPVLIEGAVDWVDTDAVSQVALAPIAQCYCWGTFQLELKGPRVQLDWASTRAQPTAAIPSLSRGRVSFHASYFAVALVPHSISQPWPPDLPPYLGVHEVLQQARGPSLAVLITRSPSSSAALWHGCRYKSARAGRFLCWTAGHLTSASAHRRAHTSHQHACSCAAAVDIARVRTVLEGFRNFTKPPRQAELDSKTSCLGCGLPGDCRGWR